MTFSNEKHMAMFALAVKNAERENYALLSAIYLLTADIRLWNCCKHHINNGCIFFENIKLRNCSERAYTLFEIAGEISKILKEDCGIEVNINTIADESEQNTAIDCTALKEDTGFSPQISFKESLMRIIEKKRTKDN